MSAIETFVDRANKAIKANSKEIRLQIEEARNIMAELSALSIRNQTLADKVIELQDQLIKIQTDQNKAPEGRIVMDGGAF